MGLCAEYRGKTVVAVDQTRSVQCLGLQITAGATIAIATSVAIAALCKHLTCPDPPPQAMMRATQLDISGVQKLLNDPAATELLHDYITSQMQLATYDKVWTLDYATTGMIRGMNRSDAIAYLSSEARFAGIVESGLAETFITYIQEGLSSDRRGLFGNRYLNAILSLRQTYTDETIRAAAKQLLNQKGITNFWWWQWP